MEMKLNEVSHVGAGIEVRALFAFARP
jgi:hypothetical protein